MKIVKKGDFTNLKSTFHIFSTKFVLSGDPIKCIVYLYFYGERKTVTVLRIKEGIDVFCEKNVLQKRVARVFFNTFDILMFTGMTTVIQELL